MIAVLSELSRWLLRVVIVSGRDTDQLASRLPIRALTLVGNHGLEERQDGRSRLISEAEAFVEPLTRTAEAIAQLPQAHIPGVSIERKLATISVHFRNAADPATAAAFLGPALRDVAARERLELHGGRKVWELRPPLQVDKGAVMRRLATLWQPGGLVYVGDDLTDGHAFKALKSMAGLTTLAVGVRSAEVPESTFAQCDLMVDGVAGVNVLLRELLTVSRSG
jgi:trehalose 6-phosphate phosphatase